MNDYDALRDYLAKQAAPELTLTFAQIEEIIDAALPGVVVGNPAQPAGEDAAARGVPCGRLHRDADGRRRQREIQTAEGVRRAVAASTGTALSLRRQGSMLRTPSMGKGV